MKWLVRKPEPKPSPQELALSELIKKRAEEQNAVIERKKDDPPEPPAKVAEKDLFE
jgi:hypothetical protein